MRRALALFLQAVGAVTVVALLACAGLLLTAGLWLKVDDAPQKAEAIVILAGDLRRAVHAADLYQQGYAPLVYVSRPLYDPPRPLCDLGLDCPRQEDQMLRVLAAKGVPAQAVRVYGQDLMSTVEEAEALARELGPGSGRLLVVTSAYHCRRARLILSGPLKGRELLLSPTPYERFETRWWTHQGSAMGVVTEAAKFVFHVLGTPFRSHPAAAD